jgi:uncharacterized membrane-anchored protein
MLLKAINKRGAIQLRLQQMVEGVSVAAMAYYLLGLIDFVLDAVIASGIDLNKVVIKGMLVPVVLILVWIFIHLFIGYIKKVPDKEN